MPIRDISLSRAIAPIFGEHVQIRTFYGRRDYHLTSGGDVRAMNNIDQTVLVTVPWLRFVSPRGMRIRRVDL